MSKLVPIRDDPKEPYIIMEFDPDNPKHVQTFADMDRHPEALKWMGQHEISSQKDLDELLRSTINDPKDPRILLAIANRENQEILGWVQYYPDKKERIEKVKKLENIPKEALFWEISFLKNMKYGDFKGVAVNGVKQTLQIVIDLEMTIAQANNTDPRPIVITAYTDPGNGASESVLKKNDFTLLPEKIEYDGEMNNGWIKRI